MKNLLNVLVVTLALNFLALAGGIGWLFKTGRLDKPRIAEIKKIVFPAPAPPPPPPPAATQPAPDEATTQPFLKLETLLAEQAGLPVGQQVEFVRQTFDAKMAEVDRRQRELLALKDQVERAQAQLDNGRKELLTAQERVAAREQEEARLASDKGFQESLQLYNSMSGRQVKKIFVALDDDTVVRYLTAMEPRTAAKIVKEFKTPEEVDRAQRILEKMRQAKPAAPAPTATAERTKE